MHSFNFGLFVFFSAEVDSGVDSAADTASFFTANAPAALFRGIATLITHSTTMSHDEPVQN